MTFIFSEGKLSGQYQTEVSFFSSLEHWVGLGGWVGEGADGGWEGIVRWHHHRST